MTYSYNNNLNQNQMFDSYSKNDMKIKYTKYLVIFFFALFFNGNAQSLHDKITGLVLDENSNPIQNVVLRTIENDSITITDEKGLFTIEIPTASQTIVFEHSNYYIKNEKFYKGNEYKKNITIRLTKAYLKNTDELDVVYGIVDKKSNIGSVATIHTNQLTNSLSQTYVNSLPGQLAGLYTQQYKGVNSGNTTANLAIDGFTGVGRRPANGSTAFGDNQQFFLNVRGQNPVVMIDGVQRDFSSIDPQNIESISVQKDALSSILLGMRSSRGVLLVTTKKPDSKGFKMSFTTQSGFQSSLSLPNPLPAYQYAYLLNEGVNRNGVGAVYSPSDFEAYRNGTDPMGHPDVNWFKTALNKNAPTSSYNLNASGGSETARYFVSLGYFTQEGLFKSDDDLNKYKTNQSLDRYLITTKLDIDVTKEFKVGLSLLGRIENGVQPGAGSSNILNNIYTTPNNAYPIYNSNGSYGGNKAFSNNIWSQVVDSGYLEDNKKDVVADINLSYDLNKFVKGLSVSGISNISVQNLSAIDRSKQVLVYQYTPKDDGSGGIYATYGNLTPQKNNFISVGNSNYWYGQVALDYKTSLGKNNLNAKVLIDQNVVSTNYDLPKRTENLAGNLKYDFDKKYFAEGAVNHSYFNGYMPGKQWGLFYAVGLGWDIAQENFAKDLNWLNQFKLRGVYGNTGNGIDNSGYYNWRQAYSAESPWTGQTYPQGYSGATGNVVLENNPLYNANITWEKANKLDVGVDISLFNNHLKFVADYYYDKYYDLLQTRGKSIEMLGVKYANENIGKNLYSGTELSLTYQNNVGNFNYFLTMNWSQQKSERLYMDEQFRPNQYNQLTGQPVNAIFGYITDGFYSSREEIEQSAQISNNTIQPGDLKYVDLNSDGVINDFDLTAIANTKPLSFYGINFGFNVKGVDLSILLQGAYNRDIYFNDGTLQNGFGSVDSSYGQGYTEVLDRWTPETAQTATFPGLRPGSSIFNQSPNFSNTSSYFVYNGDYLRVKNVSIGYTLPDQITNALKGLQVRIFATATNLFTFTDFKFGDPEVTSFTSYPMQRVISTGLNINF